MAASLALTELLEWSDSSTRFWLDFLAREPRAAAAASGVYGTETLADLARHIIGVEVRHSQRLCGDEVWEIGRFAALDLAALSTLHVEAMDRLRRLLADASTDWEWILEFDTLSAGRMRCSRRKLLGHLLLHAVRHWAQAASLARAAGVPAGFSGDLMLSSALV